MVALLGVTYLGLSRVPRSYQASATILVEPRQPGLYPNFGGAIDGPRIESLVQVLRSPDTMALVVDREGLVDIAEFSGGRSGAAARQEAVTRLINHVVVLSADGTAMIYVRARSNNAELAQRLTLAVAEAGLDRRVAMAAADIAQTEAWLAETLEQLRARAETADRAVADYLVRHGLANDPARGSLAAQNLTDLADRVGDAQQRALVSTSRAALWRQWQREDDPLRDSILAEGPYRDLLREQAASQAELAALSSELAPDHPTLRAARERDAALRKRLEAAVKSTIRDAEQEAASAEALAASLVDEMGGIRAQRVAQVAGGPELDALQREANASRAVLNDYLARHQSVLAMTGVGAILPDMRIIAHPMKPTSPNAPRTSLVLGAVGIVSAMAVLAILIIGLQNRWRYLSV